MFSLATNARRTRRRGGLAKMPTIDIPFKQVAIGIAGPISPKTPRGNRYILTTVDYATRYSVLGCRDLADIISEEVAEGHVEIFTRTGITREVLSDRETNFTFEVMREVSRLLSLKQMHTTPHHPAGNGLVTLL